MRVRATATPGTLHLELVDDGVGGAAESAGSGLKGLHRVEALGGTLDVDSADGHGTRIAAAIPAARRPPPQDGLPPRCADMVGSSRLHLAGTADDVCGDLAADAAVVDAVVVVEVQVGVELAW